MIFILFLFQKKYSERNQHRFCGILIQIILNEQTLHGILHRKYDVIYCRKALKSSNGLTIINCSYFEANAAGTKFLLVKNVIRV